MKINEYNFVFQNASYLIIAKKKFKEKKMFSLLLKSNKLKTFEAFPKRVYIKYISYNPQ